MAGVAGYFVDTSVLVAGIIELHGPKHQPQRLMAAVAEGEFERPGTTWHCCLEFYSVATRLPREFRVTAEVAAELGEHEVMERFVVHSLPRDDRRGRCSDSASKKYCPDLHFPTLLVKEWGHVSSGPAARHPRGLRHE
jgi:hypothetical protein